MAMSSVHFLYHVKCTDNEDAAIKVDASLVAHVT
jgi:hypothetical protein